MKESEIHLETGRLWVDEECKKGRRLIKDEAGEVSGCQPVKDKGFECYPKDKNTHF